MMILWILVTCQSRRSFHVRHLLIPITFFAAADDAMELEEKLFERCEDYETRRGKQVEMPAFPTTTIGSFPQTNGAMPLRPQMLCG